MRQYVPLNKREKLLESSEPVITFGARDEGRLQHQLDVATLQTLEMLKKQQTKLQKELKTASNHVDIRLKKIFAGRNSNLLDEVNSQRTQTFAPEIRKGNAASPSPRRQLARSPAPQRGDAPLKAKVNSGSRVSPRHSTTTRLSVFPVAFEESEFSSSIRWAEVAFTEASVAALGPGASAEGPCRGDFPNPLMASVACYILNEVLKRDSNMRGLWALLRDTIFDSIYSPLRIGGEVQGCDAQEQGGNGGETLTATNSDISKGRVLTYPQRKATYETLFDFSNYCLWIQEIVALQRKNDVPWQRIQELKSSLKGSVHVLELVRRRADNSWLQKVFLAWHRYTQHAHRFRKASMMLILNSMRRRVEGQCFLRWRRATLHGKLEKLYSLLSEHKRDARMNEQAHLNTILQLRNQLSAVTDAKRLMQAELEDQLLGVKESHSLSEKALRAAYKRSVKYAERYKKHARRWERLAKTFRPTEPCPRVPKSLFALSVSLTKYEGELSKPYQISTFRIDLARKELSKFLLCWVNMVMRASPRGKVWIPREHIASSSRVQGDGTASCDVAIKSKTLNEAALLCLVRELRRLQEAGNEFDRQECSEFNDTFRSSTLLGTGDIADEMTTALEEAYQVLYTYTSEGLYPCLLMHCPRFFFQHRTKDTSTQSSAKNRQLDEFVYTLSVLWLLAALFTGYVRFHYGIEAFLPCKCPQYLRCANEKKLQRSARQSLGVPSVSSLTELPNNSVTCSLVPLVKDDNAAGGNGTANGEGGDREHQKGSPEASLAADLAAATDLTTSMRALSTSSFLVPRNPAYVYAFRGDDIGDTNSDIDVYTGREDANLPPSDWEKDVDGILNDLVRDEEHEMRKRRRLRRKEEEHEAQMQASSESPLPHVSVEGVDMSEGRNLEVSHSKRKSAFQKEYKTMPNKFSNEKCSSRGASLEAASVDSQDSLPPLHNGSEQDDKSASEASTTSEDELMDTDSDDEVATMSLQGNQRGSKGLFGGPHDSLEVVRRQFLTKVPLPSSVFSVHTGKKSRNKNSNRGVLLLQSPGERTEARRLERAKNGGLHAFVERTLVDRDRRQRWFGMARVVVSLITRLRLLDINMKTKTAKISSAERSSNSYDRPESSKKSRSKHNSEARISVSRRTKVSSTSLNTVSSKPILRIAPGGEVTTGTKPSYPNLQCQKKRNPRIKGEGDSTQPMIDQNKGAGNPAEVCAPQKRPHVVDPSAEAVMGEDTFFDDSNVSRGDYALSTVMMKGGGGEGGGRSLGASPSLNPVNSFPPVSTSQTARRVLAPDAHADVNGGITTRASMWSLPPTFPRGPLDPMIIRPEVPYKGPRCKMLYRFDLQDKER
ncbi:unnamed protein product [Phytomonas sp. EM1]|nr:unnamed protein product [Phytomonas sp. EM1]|eukprot:CCW61182.1 unnamed protein product [Phytomonas sp. isolate EM1]